MRLGFRLIALVVGGGVLVLAPGPAQAQVKGKVVKIFCGCEPTVPRDPGFNCQSHCCNGPWKGSALCGGSSSTSSGKSSSSSSSTSGSSSSSSTGQAIQAIGQAVGQAIAGALAEKQQRDAERKEAERLAAEFAQRQAMIEAQQRRDEERRKQQEAFESAKQAAYSEMLGLKPDDSLGMMDPFASGGTAPCDPDECLARCPSIPDALGGRKVDPACVQGCLAKDCGGTVRVSGPEPRESEYLEQLQLRQAAPPPGPWTAEKQARLDEELDEIIGRALEEYQKHPPQPKPVDPLDEMFIELVVEQSIEQAQVDELARDWEREQRRDPAARAEEIFKARPGPSELLSQEIESLSKDPKLEAEIETIRSFIRKKELELFAAARARAVAQVRAELKPMEKDPAFEQIFKGSVLSATRSLMEELNRTDREAQAALAREIQRLKDRR